MAVLVLGGYGLIGSAIVGRLRADGLRVVGLGRNVAAARARRPDVEWRRADLSHLTRPEAWEPLLSGVDVVVNAAGVLQAGLGDDPAVIQQHAMTALYEQARQSSVRRIVQVSAVDASPAAPTTFLRTKAAADAALLASGVEAVILRPGLVVSPIAYGGTALLRALAAFPVVTPLVYPRAQIQAVAVDEVAEAVARAVAGAIPAGSVADLVEPRPRTLAETVRLFRAHLGLPEARAVPLPSFVARPVSAIADLLGWLGWRSPLRTTAIAALRDGVTGDATAAAAALGRPCRALPEILAALPAGPQERWFGRLWLLRPAVLATLSIFWIASGLIGLAERDAAVAILTSRGAGEGFATSAVWAGGFADLGLGLAVLFRPSAAPALAGMILVSLAYMIGAILWAPDIWLDPLGPMVKVVPAVFLALVALAVLDAR